MSRPDGEAPCGPNADDRYCARYWEMSAEVDRLRERIAAVRKRAEAVAPEPGREMFADNKGIFAAAIIEELDAES
jgi:hypothetical protein